MKTVSTICDGLTKFFKMFFYLSGVVLMVILVISFAVVMLRAFDISPIWSDEIQRFLMVGMVFAAIPYMASEKTFLVVDLAATLFPSKTKMHNVTVLIGEIIFFVLLVYLIFPCVELTVKNANTYSSALRLPMSYMYSLMPISFGLGAIGMLKNLVKFVVDRYAAKTEEVQ